MKHILYLIFLVPFLLCCSQEHPEYTGTNNGICFVINNDSVVISAITENIIRVNHYNLPYRKEIEQVNFVFPVNENVNPVIKEGRNTITLSTSELKVTISDKGTIKFSDRNGKSLTKAIKPDVLNHKQAFTCGDEALYGMGQFQNGLLNLKSVPLHLQHFNQEIANPFLVSTRGYGILWNNTSVTDFNFPDNELELTEVIDAQKNIRKTVFIPEQSGFYYFSVASPNEGGNRFSGPVLLTFNNDTVIHYNTIWVPNYFSGKKYLEKGKQYEVVLTNSNTGNPGKVYYNTPDNDKTVFQSQCGNGVDYYFIGGTPAEAIAGYRKLTGAASLFGKWAYGFWQCRERYHSQQELLDNAEEYRSRGIPVDNIVQDWNYWPGNTWGPEWDRTQYPDPQEMCSELKKLNIHLMVSVWPKINNQRLEESYQLTKLDNDGNVDFYNPEMGNNYYRMLKDAMFDIGVSSIWLDGTEPETQPFGKMTSAGLFDHNALIFSYLVTRSVYEGHRKDFPAERVFNLTRSGFAGQQSFGAAVWSGDVTASWEQLREQITAGLNFSMSGLPYWTTDIGGFFRDSHSFNSAYDDQYTNDDYKELLTRWFQYGTFCPLFRIHGYVSETEVWRYGKTFEQTAREYINLRYRLMPYIYSTAGDVTQKGEIMMKPLAHDYPEDEKCRDVTDQFLFGKSMMICPVTSPHEYERSVYLPEGRWIDFWSGKTLQGNGVIISDAPLDKIPIFIKAGTILPVGPEVQYAMQETATPLKIFIYPGADGTLGLYEDEGENYNYENGHYSIIKFTWDDSANNLVIEKRKGTYEGMIMERKFELVRVKEGDGGLTLTSQKEIAYDGNEMKISLN